MVWRRAVLAAVAVVAAFATETRAEFACPDGQFPVSVLDDPQIQCLTSRPCSGVYGPEGLIIGVGACPSGTGCALLPHNPSVMGCVKAGRDDVAYVNPDGSLTRGGKVISGPPTNNGGAANNGGNSAYNSTAPTSAPTKAPTPTSAPVSTTTDPGHVKPGGGSASGTSEGSVSTTTPATETPATTTPESTTSAPTTTTPSTSTTNQQALDDISGEIANNKRGVDTTTGLGFGSIIAIVVGCLAVVAIIAGVFVLRKKKEQSIGTPEGALEDYGAGGVTPKENVLLL